MRFSAGKGVGFYRSLPRALIVCEQKEPVGDPPFRAANLGARDTSEQLHTACLWAPPLQAECRVHVQGGVCVRLGWGVT